jgi:hypothetical protein
VHRGPEARLTHPHQAWTSQEEALRGARPRQNGQSVLIQGTSRVVILNGGSSAGKTTLGTAFRDQRAADGDFWLLIGIDDFLAKLPWRSAERAGAEHSQRTPFDSRPRLTGLERSSAASADSCSARTKERCARRLVSP